MQQDLMLFERTYIAADEYARTVAPCLSLHA